MKVLLFSSVIAVALFSIMVHPVPVPDDNDADHFDDFEKGNPMVMVAAEIALMQGIRCRKGFNNISDDMVDATNKCAGIKKTQLGRRRMGDEKIQMDGATPFLCLRTCVLNHTGMMNTHRQGVNETRLMEVYSYEMSKPGGEKSAFRLVKEIMDCDRKHFTLFPRYYSNCTDAEDFLRCVRRVVLDCDEKNTTMTDILYSHYLEKKKKKRAQMIAQGIAVPDSAEDDEATLSGTPRPKTKH